MYVGIDTMELNCSLPIIERSFNEKEWKKLSEKQQQELNNRIDAFSQRMNMLASLPLDESQSRLRSELVEQLDSRYKFIMQAASMMHISPNATRNLEYFLAYDFAMVKNVGGLGDTLTQPGAVRYWLNRAKRIGQGESHVFLANIEFLDKAATAERNIERLRRRLGINKDTMDRIKLDAYELGFEPYGSSRLKITGPEAIEFNRARQSRLRRTMSKAGMDSPAQEELARYITHVIDSYAEVYEVAERLGVNINDASGAINYLPRNFSPEARRRIYWSKESTGQYAWWSGKEKSGGSLESAYSMFTRSRSSNHFIAEDAVLLDFVLTSADPKIYEKMGVEHVNDLLEDSKRFTESFVKYLDKKQPELFDHMVDSGLVSKLPMTTNELWSYMVTKYKLPFETLNEFVSTDFNTTARLYRNQLEQLAGKSLASQFTAKAALEGGWGVTSAQRFSDDAYSKYVPLVSPPDGTDVGVIPIDIATRFGLLGKQNTSVYVHPQVAAFYRAAIDLGSDPERMGILGKIIYDFNSIFKASALATSGFVFRQLMNVAVQTHAAGGNILNYSRNITRMLSQVTILWSQKKSLDGLTDIFDNTVKRYQSAQGMLTERELWNYLRRQGVIEDIMPWTGEPVHSLNYTPSANALEAVRRQTQYAVDVLRSGELSLPGKFSNLYGQASSATRRISEEVFYSFQLFNSLFDNVARFSTIQSLSTNDVVDRVTRGLQGNMEFRKTPMNVDQAVSHAENFFYRYGDLGRVDQGVRTLVPFYSFISRNTFAGFRMLVRNPSRFVAYNRLYAAINSPASEEGDDLPEAGVPGWLQRTNPLYWIREDDEGNKTYIAIPLTSLDPVQDAQRRITDAADDLLSLFGVARGNRTSDEVLKTLPWDRSSTNRTITNMIAETYPLYQSVYAFITGEDVEGRVVRDDDYSAFLGVEMTPMMRYLLETNLPLLRNINRANPFYMFGRPPRYDNQTGEIIDKPIPSWITGAERAPRDYISDFRSASQRTASALGINTYVIDVAYNMGYTEQQIDFQLQEGFKAIQKKARNITLIQDPARAARELHELEEMKFIQAQLLIDWHNFRAWRAARGLQHPAAVRLMQKQNLSREQLQTLTEQEEYELLRTIYGDELP